MDVPRPSDAAGVSFVVRGEKRRAAVSQSVHIDGKVRASAPYAGDEDARDVGHRVRYADEGVAAFRRDIVGDDIGDIVWCMDDISERFHLMISDTWFEERDGLAGWLRTLGERWGRNGVELLCIEDPRGRMYPVYAAEASDVPGILQQAGRAGITIFPVRELGESAGESDMDVDFSELV